MNTLTKNMVAMAEHTIGAVIGIMIILGQFFSLFDNDSCHYLLIISAFLTAEFVFDSEETKKNNSKKAAIICIISTLLSIVLFVAFKGMWVFNAHSWYLFLGTAVASMNLSMIILFIRSRRK